MGNLNGKDARSPNEARPNSKLKVRFSRAKSKSTSDVAPLAGDQKAALESVFDINHNRTQSLKDRNGLATKSRRSKDTLDPASAAQTTYEAGTNGKPISREPTLKSKTGASAPKQAKREPNMSPSQKSLLKDSWETSPHNEIGNRIFSRLFQKRPDIRRAYERITAAKPDFSWRVEAKEFTAFMNDVMNRLESMESVQDLCFQRGKQYAPLREHGFKAQFWVPMSEIMTTECLYLDRGLNSVADVLDAWAALISYMLSYMRDGFYAELRFNRRESKRRFSQRKRDDLTLSKSSYELRETGPNHLGASVDDLNSISASDRMFRHGSSEESAESPCSISPDSGTVEYSFSRVPSIQRRMAGGGTNISSTNFDEYFGTPAGTPPK